MSARGGTDARDPNGHRTNGSHSGSKKVARESNPNSTGKFIQDENYSSPAKDGENNHVNTDEGFGAQRPAPTAGNRRSIGPSGKWGRTNQRTKKQHSSATSSHIDTDPQVFLGPAKPKKETWRTELKNDFDKDFLIDGITNGFNILNIPHDIIDTAEVYNYKSATDNAIRDKVERQITSEIAQGNYVISQTKPTIISALGAIPKKDSNDVRLIHDCSRPEGASVNSYATCEHYAYETVERACKLIKPGAFMAKVDLKSAYRHIPIRPSNYAATGLKWTFSGDSHHTICHTHDVTPR
ncbi:hypothetical protein AC249_AIPGENE24810 [Exaiptasia diaphana]|nr:hypothetical protein AC249_AIPGENE24810 [Exaiptasia diaphana]